MLNTHFQKITEPFIARRQVLQADEVQEHVEERRQRQLQCFIYIQYTGNECIINDVMKHHP